MMVRQRLKVEDIPDRLPEFMTVSDIAEVMRVTPPTVIRYAETEALFPSKVNRVRGALYRRGEVLRWLRSRHRRVRSKPSMGVDELGKVVGKTSDLPALMGLADIAALMGIQVATVRRYALERGFPAKAFGESVAIYRGSEIRTWLLQRAQGVRSKSDASLADPARDPLSIDEIASILGVSGTSMRAIRSQRDREIFPRPLADEDGKQIRPAVYARADVVRYLQAYVEHRERHGRGSPSALAVQISNEG